MDVPLRAALIFAVTYLLMSGWRLRWLPLGRPAGALAGAVAMVGLGVLTPRQAYDSVNFDTIVLLLGTMILSAHLGESGFYDGVVARLGNARVGATGLLALLVIVSGGLSALLVNDTVCLMLTPLVVSLVVASGLPPLPFLMALATSANIGSALTLTGNPQNMLVGTMSGMTWTRFSGALLLPVAASLAANAALLRWYYRRELAAAPMPKRSDVPAAVDRPLLVKSLACLGVAVAGFAATPWTGLSLAWTALAAAVLLLVVARRDPRRMLEGLDWSLLLFFSGLFVVIGGLGAAGWLHDLERRVALPLLGEGALRQSLHLSWLTVAGSQVFSNVPWVLVAGGWVPRLAEPEVAWVILGFVSTVAGNLTILGSVANVIVLEGARDVVRVGFLDYLRFGWLTTVASIALGGGVLFLEQQLGWI